MIAQMARRYPLAGWLVMALAILLFLALSEAASGCPTCKAGLASHDPAHGDLVGAYMWSILFLMAMPFTLLGSFSAYLYWIVRRARAEKAAQLALAGALAVEVPIAVEVPGAVEDTLARNAEPVADLGDSAHTAESGAHADQPGELLGV